VLLRSSLALPLLPMGLAVTCSCGAVNDHLGLHLAVCRGRQPVSLAHRHNVFCRSALAPVERLAYGATRHEFTYYHPLAPVSGHASTRVDTQFYEGGTRETATDLHIFDPTSVSKMTKHQPGAAMWARRAVARKQRRYAPLLRSGGAMYGVRLQPVVILVGGYVESSTAQYLKKTLKLASVNLASATGIPKSVTFSMLWLRLCTGLASVQGHLLLRRAQALTATASLPTPQP